jgi:hypothetical protein
MYQRLEADEAALQNVATSRLDTFVNVERTKAIDDYTLELIDGGVI